MTSDWVDALEPLAGVSNNAPNDRSHEGSLQGNLRQQLVISGQSPNAESDLIPIMKATHELDVTVVILDLVNDDIEYYDQEILAQNHMKIAQEVWAQAGVKVNYNVTTIPAEGEILDLLADNNVVVDSSMLSPLTEDGKILDFVKARVPAGKAVLIYVPTFVADPYSSPRACAMTYYGNPANYNSQFDGYVILSGRDLRAGEIWDDTRHVAAHELGHGLNLKHNRIGFPSRPENHLMKEGGGSQYIYDIRDAKRLDPPDIIKAKNTQEAYFNLSQP